MLEVVSESTGRSREQLTWWGRCLVSPLERQQRTNVGLFLYFTAALKAQHASFTPSHTNTSFLYLSVSNIQALNTPESSLEFSMSWGYFSMQSRGASRDWATNLTINRGLAVSPEIQTLRFGGGSTEKYPKEERSAGKSSISRPVIPDRSPGKVWERRQ